MELSKKNLGKSVEGNDIISFSNSSLDEKHTCGHRLLILAGVHGNETEGVWASEKLIGLIQKGDDSFMAFENLVFEIVPKVNPDGILKLSRLNSNGVDLNRNLPTQDWSPVILDPRYPPGPCFLSEPENIILVELIQKFNPTAVVSLHSFSEPQINLNGSRKIIKDLRLWAEEISKYTHYPVTEDIGYPTPGSLGTYAGMELEIPTITLEILRGLSQEKCESETVELLKNIMKTSVSFV